MTDEVRGMWEKVDFSISSSQKRVNGFLKESREKFDGGDYKNAVEGFLSCVGEDPDNLEAHYYLGLCYTKLEDLNKAIMHFNEIVLSRYQYIHVFRVHGVLGYIYTLQGDYETAKDHLAKCLDQDEGDVKTLSILAYISYREKKYEEALDYYGKILGLDGENANAYNSMGMIYIETEEDIEKGISICKRALELSPDCPAYLDSVGWGYFKKKDEIQAIDYLRRAFEIAPDNQEIKQHLKDVLNI
ncbi:MAG: tetratricopeptide repeat protein [Spirochaetota bacterium]|nr:tetratricopeptide repeat protein [Spirochaetota bacterium]